MQTDTTNTRRPHPGEPLDDETRRRLEAAGVQIATGVGGAPWRAAGKRRPRIVAFFLRLLHLTDRDRGLQREERMQTDTTNTRRPHPSEPLDDETRRRLEAAGVQIATGVGGAPWRPIKRRPKIVAFLLRLFT